MSGTAAALGHLAGVVFRASDDAGASSSDITTIGGAALYNFERIALHIMATIQEIDLDEVVLLDHTCEHIMSEMSTKLQVRNVEMVDATAVDDEVVEENQDDRLEALGALSLVAKQANFTTLAALCAILSVADENARDAARHAFCEIIEEEEQRKESPVGQQKASNAEILNRLRSADVESKQALLELIPGVVAKGNAQVVEACCEYTGDADRGIRCEAIKALCLIADKGNQQSMAITLALRLSKDADKYVRIAAIEALGSILVKAETDASTIIQLVESALDGERYVRRASLTLLRKLADRGNVTVVASLTPYLTHEEVDVRCAAIKALAQFVDPRDHALRENLVVFLEDEDEAEEVRITCAEALTEIMPVLQILERELAAGELALASGELASGELVSAS